MASNSNWVNSSNPYFKRGNGGIFSFNNNNASNSYYCRGVAVCGAGLLYRMKCSKDISKSEGKISRSFPSISIYKRNVIPSLTGKK